MKEHTQPITNEVQPVFARASITFPVIPERTVMLQYAIVELLRGSQFNQMRCDEISMTLAHMSQVSALGGEIK